MSDKKNEIKTHATSSGRLYIKDEDFLKSTKVQSTIQRMINSSIYQDIKKRDNSNK